MPDMNLTGNQSDSLMYAYRSLKNLQTRNPGISKDDMLIADRGKDRYVFVHKWSFLGIWMRIVRWFRSSQANSDRDNGIISRIQELLKNRLEKTTEEQKADLADFQKQLSAFYSHIITPSKEKTRSEQIAKQILEPLPPPPSTPSPFVPPLRPINEERNKERAEERVKKEQDRKVVEAREEEVICAQETQERAAFVEKEAQRAKIKTDMCASLAPFCAELDEEQKDILSDIVIDSPQQESILQELSEQRRSNTLYCTCIRRLSSLQRNSKEEAYAGSLLHILEKIAPQRQGRVLPTTGEDILDVFFLGEAGREGVNMWDLVEHELEDFLSTQGADQQEMIALLHNAIRLGPEPEMINRLQERIRTMTPGQKQLLFGGWVNHGVVYEIEKQQHDTYTIRVFDRSRSAGAVYLEDDTSRWKEKMTGCVVRKDVSLASLEGSFFNKIISLLTVAEHPRREHDNTPQPSQILKNCIENLGGSPGHIPEALARALSAKSPEKSHLSSLLACYAAHCPEFPFYRAQKTSLKMGILEKALSALKEKCDQPVNSFEERNSLASFLVRTRRAIEEFSSYIVSEKRCNGIGKEKQKEADLLIAQCTHSLVQLEKNIDEFERSQALSVGESTDRRAEAVTVGELPALPSQAVSQTGEEVRLQSRLFSQAARDLLDQLTSGRVSVEGLITQIADNLDELSHDREVLFYCVDQLCRKIGPSTTDWNTKLRLKDVPNGFQNLKKISLTLADALFSSQVADPTPEQYCVYLACSYGMECAFRQLPQEQNVLGKRFDSCLAPLTRQVAFLPCHDSFWCTFINSIKGLGGQNAPFGPIHLWDTQAETNGLTMRDLMPSLQTWYRVSQALRTRVEQGIAAIRRGEKTEQEQTIQQQLQESSEETHAIIAQAFSSVREQCTKLEQDIEKNRAKLKLISEHINTLNKQIQEFPWRRRACAFRTDIQEEEKAKELAQLDKEIATLRSEQHKEGVEKTILEEQQKKCQETLKALTEALGDPLKALEVKIRELEAHIKSCHQKVQLDSTPLNEKERARREIASSESMKGQMEWFVRESRIKNTQLPVGIEQNQEELLRLFFTAPDFCKRKLGLDPIPEALREFGIASVRCQNIFFQTSALPPEEKTGFQLLYDFKERECKSRYVPYGSGCFGRVASSDLLRERFDDYKTVLPFRTRDLFDKIHGIAPVIGETAIPMLQDQLSDRGCPLPPDDIRAFLRMRCGASMQLYSVLNYLLQKRENLGDNTYLNLLHALLFDESDPGSDKSTSLLRRELLDPEERPVLLKTLKDCIRSGIAASCQTKQFHIAAQFLWLGKSIQRFVDETGQREEIISDGSFRRIIEGAIEAGVPKEQYPILFEAVMASASSLFEKNPISEEEIASVLFARVMMAQYPTSLQERCRPRGRGAERSILNCKKFLSFHPRETSHIVERELLPFLQKVFPGLQAARLRTDDGDVFVGENVQFCLSSGMVESQDGAFILPSNKPISNEIRTLFVSNGLFDESDDCADRVCQVKEIGDVSITMIQDLEKRAEYKVEKRGDAYTIYVKRDGSDSYDFFVPKASRTYIENRAIQERFIHLRRDGQLLLCDAQKLNVVYEYDPATNHLSKNSSHTTPERVHLVQTSIEDRLFTSFEDPAHTLLLANEEGILQQIEFPRHGLIFIREGEKWILSNQPTWHLSSDQYIPHFGQNSGYLVLENEKKEKKVLFPVWPPVRQEGAQSTSWAAPYLYDFNSREDVCFVECFIKDGVLEPVDFSARFYIAKMLLEKQCLDEAEALLFDVFAHALHQPFSPLEKKLLLNLIAKPSSGVMGTRSLRLRMQALAILSSNTAQFPEEKTPTAHERALKRAGEQLQKIAQKRKKTGEEHQALLDTFPMTGSLEDQQRWGTKWSKKEKLLSGICLRLIHIEQALQKEYNEISDKVDKEKRQEQETRNSLFYEVNTLFLAYVRRLDHMKPIDPLEEVQILSSGLIGSLQKDEKILIQKRREWLQTSIPEENVSQHVQEEGDHVLQQNGGRAAFPDSEQLRALQTVRCSEDERVFTRSLVQASQQNEEQKEDLFECTTLFDSKHAVAGTDPTVHALFDQMREDITKVEEDAQGKRVYTFEDVEGLRESLEQKRVETLVKQHEIESQIQEALVAHSSLFLSALSSSAQSDQESLARLTVESKMRQTLPTVQELCILFAYVDYEERVKQRYPNLSTNDIQTLRRALQQFLKQKRFNQHLEKSLGALERVLKETDAEKKSELLNDFGALLETKQEYKDNDPYEMVYLLMETFQGFKIRKAQVETIQEIAQAGKEGQELVRQLIMGGGKTTVLSPALAFITYMLTSPDRSQEGISSIVLPDSLYGKVKGELRKTLGSSYRQLLVALPYNRTLAKNNAYLYTYVQKLEGARLRKSCLYMTPKQLQSIQTSHYETLLSLEDDPENENLQERFQLISKIVTFLKTHQCTIVDEVDKVSNPRIVLTYPLGQSRPIAPERAHVIAQLFFALAQDEQVNGQVKIDCFKRWRERSGQTAPTGEQYSAEEYQSKVKPALVAHAINILGNTIENFTDRLGSDGSVYLEAFLKQEFPQQPADFHAQMERILKEKFPGEEEQGILGACADAINSFLPRSLGLKSGVHFCQDPRNGFYVPRPAEDNVVKTTQYANPYQKAIMSVQHVLSEGIPFDAARRMLLNLQQQAQSEEAHGLEKKAQRAFSELIPEATFSLDKSPFSDDDVELFRSRASCQEVWIMRFLQEHVYNQIKIFPKNVSCTATRLFGMSKRNAGFSGTLPGGLLPQSIRVKKQLGTDGATIAAVERKMASQTSKTIVYPSQENMSERILTECAKSDGPSVIIDSGGDLRKEKFPEYAVRMLLKARDSGRNISGVVYIKEADERRLYIVEMVDGVPQERRLEENQKRTLEGDTITIIDQKGETGTDIPQVRDAKAFITIRKDIPLDRLLQSIFRMRQILEGHNITLAISQEVKEHIVEGVVKGLFQLFHKADITEESIRESLSDIPQECIESAIKSFHEFQAHPDQQEALRKGLLTSFNETIQSVSSSMIWRYAAANKAYADQKANWMAAQQRMREVLEAPLASFLSQPPPDEASALTYLQAQQRVFKKLESFFIESSSDDPFIKMMQQRSVLSAHDAIQARIQHFSAMYAKWTEDKEIADIFKEAYNNDSLTVDDMKQKLESCVKEEEIPSWIDMGEEEDVEVEEEAEAEAETESETETETQTENEDIGLDEIPAYIPLSLANYRSTGVDSPIQPLNAALPENIRSLFGPIGSKISFSPNLFMNPPNGIPDPLITSVFRRNYYLLSDSMLIVRGDPVRYVLLSTTDAINIKKSLSESRDMTLVQISDGRRISGAEGALSAEEFLEARVVAKMCMGDLSVSDEEIQVIRRMIARRESEDRSIKRGVLQKELRSFVHTVIDHRKSAMEKWPHSDMMRALS